MSNDDNSLASFLFLTLSNSYTIVCPPVRGDNPRALASGFSPVQADKLCYNYCIPPLIVQNLLSAKYFVLKLVFSSNGYKLLKGVLSKESI